MTKEEKDRKAEERARAMQEYYNIQAERDGCAGPTMLMLLAVVLILTAVVGCRVPEYVEVPVTHTEYVYRDRVDTSYMKDSIYIREQVKGDTVQVVEYRYRDRFRTITATDTLVLRDTVAVVREKVVVQTDHTLTRGQKALQDVGIVSLFFLLLFLLSLLRKIFRRF